MKCTRDGNRTKFGRGHGGQAALKTPHGSADGGNDVNGARHEMCFRLKLPAKLGRFKPIAAPILRAMKLSITNSVFKPSCNKKQHGNSRYSSPATARSPERIPNLDPPRTPAAYANAKGLEVGIQRVARSRSTTASRLGRAPVLPLRISAFFCPHVEPACRVRAWVSLNQDEGQASESSLRARA